MKSSKLKRGRTHDSEPSGGLLRAQSVVQGVVAPAIGNPATNAVLSIYYQLQQSEWYAPSVLAEQQWRQLCALVEAAANTPHYAAILAQLGYAAGAPFTQKMWDQMPILSREELQSSGQDLLNSNLEKIYGASSLTRTAGLTGSPVEVQHPQILNMFNDAVILREQMWHRRDLNGRYAYLQVFKDQPAAQTLPGLKVPGWRALERVVATGGESFALDIHVPLDEQIRWLESIDPHYLATSPSNLKALLGRVAARSRTLQLPSLREVRTMSETVDDELRVLLADTLAVPLVDDYSTQEVGHIAFQCPDAPVYHCLSEFVKVEILREDDSACEVGETGRVIVTHLHNLRMPLIRYDIGDYAQVGEPCCCGRGLPVLNRVLGRSSGMLHYPDEGRRWPPSGDGRYREIAPIEQYQLIQTSLTNLRVNLVVARPLSAGESQAFIEWVQQRFEHPFEIQLQFFDEIPRHASGKFENFRCELPLESQHVAR